MSNNNDSSLHETGIDGHQPVSETLSPESKDLKEWFKEYMAADADSLSKESSLIQVVSSDELDADFVEQRIQESTPKDLVTKGFCAKCQHLFDNWPTLGDSSTKEHDSGPDPDKDGWENAAARSGSTFELEGSARSGCRFCTFLLQSLKDSNVLDIFRKVEVRLYHLGEDAMASLSIQNWGSNPSQLLWMNFPGKVCTHCNSGIALEGNVDSAFLPASADCFDELPDVFDTASNWLSTCSENHELCKSDDSGILPTRLISIASESPRLVLTAELPQRPRYATLSHSWGSHDVIKLLSEDLESFRKEIPVEQLPRTFTDAILITRKFGLDYLWIDSLCIIQDEQDDWHNESALMSSVYGGSTITIAASSARDSSQGCFLKQPMFSGGLRARITDGGRQRVQDFRSQEGYERSTFKTHLGTRAWALQEKMLPPRTIHFSDRGAFWECRTKIASEFLPDGFPNQLVSPLVRRQGNFEWFWPQIVQLYSAANLTFGKDKLPALSGIARLGHSETGDEYLAGLWRRQIEEQLCWRLWNSKSSAKRPPWRAPTWSWASVDGGVGWRPTQENILETKHAHVLDASTTKEHDPFGQVTSGVIRLACSTMAVGHLIETKKSDEPKDDGRTIIALHFGDEEREYSIQIDCLDEGYHKDDEKVYLVPILSGKTGSATGGEDEDSWLYEWMIEGIVLRATSVKKGEYSRIGSFNILKNGQSRGFHVEDDSEAYESFLQALAEHGTTISEAACAETISNSEYPDEKYIITVI